MRQVLLRNATAILLQNETDVFYKMRQVFYYKMRQFYYKMRHLLQIATILLQNATVITKSPERYQFHFNFMSIFTEFTTDRIIFKKDS